MSRQSNELKRVIWQDTPETLQWVEVAFGLVSWILLGTYLGLAEGYDTISLSFFFVFQMLYIGKNTSWVEAAESNPPQGLMFWEAKKKKSENPSTIELFAVLTLSILVLMIHLFLAGTYAAIIVRYTPFQKTWTTLTIPQVVVFQNSLINDLILYTLGRQGLVHL